MSDSTSSCNESAFTESKDEYLSETFDGSIDYRKLCLQNENYRQELYEMQLKCAHNEAMQKELQEANELLEQLFAKEKEKADKKLQEIQEKNRKIQEEYENQLSDLAIELEKKEKENKEFHNMLVQHKTEISQANIYKPDHIEEQLAPLQKQIQELSIKLEHERRKKEEAEEMIQNLNEQILEIQEILQVTKNNLREKNEVLEDTREKLAMCNAELKTLKTVPANALSKGNSLFAEVEDLRQVALNKAVTLRKKYDEVKQAYNAKLQEVRLLKIEKSAILRKWDDYVNIFSEDNNDLILKYKNRIRELENKLAETQKNNIEIKITDSSFSYMESLLAEKKKEIQELHQKVERDSIDMLLQAEIKHKITKQLNYWQCKAMHMEAQLSAIKSQLELEHANSPEYALFFEAVEKYKTIYKDFSDKDAIAVECENQIEKVTSKLTTLEEKLSVPYPKSKNILEKKIVDTNTSLQLINMGETTTDDHNSEVDKSSSIHTNSVDYDNSNTSVFEAANAMQYNKEQNSTPLCLDETHKLPKIVHFSADTKSSPSNSMTKRKQNEEKKKITRQYKTMYISSESSK